MPSVGMLDVRLNCFHLLQRHIPLYFCTSHGFHAQAVLNEVNGNKRGKERLCTSRSSSHFVAPPRSKEREEQGGCVQMEEAKTAECRSKLSAEQRKGRQQEEPKTKMKATEKDEFSTLQIDTFDTRLVKAATERRR
ncbi:uncharacterized protein MONOS_16145 [Monocercomonoides exilis]|uniref:uncharacterized protein n=1 Tax=Monocercomonoides exilis TaxID=2049356 RepID=UPI00355AC308|nr:hypothetical protein MONOS_16145 [Monocercomonoides exilis]|eukprot:MONOS_16145.1-p1 / transcript=MONOS_16145.1 / gene=MONOS_16145 / organism=Monocercomonoides_exilis_PA203 / gene_product=unspecified product / transcript_product=unspecified product / location=Mono_scaffold01529:2537-2944(-) / protein_length=136 / sequence_SO=supercontig / SO=protein_coding / is_pseudo=false